MRRINIVLAFLLLTLLSTFARASSFQKATEQPGGKEQQSQMPMGSQPMGQPGSGGQPQGQQPMGGMMGGMQQMMGNRDMEQMAITMTRAAEMCQMMMQQEMASAPLKIGGLLFLGGLLTVVLVLLAILEVQWIRYWSGLLRAQRQGP